MVRHSYNSYPISQDKPDLTRIRDNQRRSRARRKAYVQDLEKRLRSFERQGVEVTLQVQKAARRVAEENKLLRALLCQHGFEDRKISELLQTNAVATTSPLLQAPPQAIGFTTQPLELALGHQSSHCFNPTVHPAIFTPRLAKSEDDDSTAHAILPDHERVSTSPTPVCPKTCCWSPPSHGPFDFCPQRYSTSFSSESSDACTVDTTERLDQLYALAANNTHPTSDEAPDTTRTNHGPSPLGLIDQDLELVRVDFAVHDHIAALQLQQGEGRLLDDLVPVQSAVSIGCVAPHDVSFFDLGQK